MRNRGLLCAVGAVCASTFAAGLGVREEAIAVRFANHSARIQFEVSTDDAGPARIAAEWLDPMDRVLGRGESTVRLNAGQSQTATVTTDSPIGLFAEANEAMGLILRLRYSIVAPNGKTAGIVSLSDLRSNYLILVAKLPEQASRSHPLRFFARAVEPRGYAVTDAKVRAKVRFTEHGKPVEQTVAADHSGKAAFEFAWPAGVKSEDLDEIKISIEAISGDVHRTSEAAIDVDESPTLYVSTDKSLYQPGQTLHMRAIAFDDVNRAMSGRQLVFIVSKNYQDVLFTGTAAANRFGVAAIDWTIPDNAETAQYRVVVKTKDSSSFADKTIRISHYELPTFEFTAKPARQTAKPGETFTVAFDAKYLHGAPLKSGTVTISGQRQMYWADGKLQPVEVESGEGTLDSNGHAEIELTVPEFESGTPPWSISYIAAVTEPDTKREEERTFSIALRGGTIRISTIGTLPSTVLARPLYLRANYLSGKPCLGCTIEIRERSAKFENRSLRYGAERLTATVQTNSLGIAIVPDYQPGKLEDWASALEMRLEARDASGNLGSGETWLGQPAQDSGPDARIDLERVRLRPGEPAKLIIQSPAQSGTFLIGVTSGQQVIDTFQIALDHGRAEIEYPDPQTAGEQVTFVVAGAAENSGALDQVTAFYRRSQPLRVDIHMDRTQYRPGAEARARIEVKTTDGKPVEAAIGASAIDRAVILRARGASQGDDEDTPPDDRAWIASLDWNAPLSPDQESLVRVLSHERAFWGGGLDYESGINIPFQNAFQPWLMSKLGPFRKAVNDSLAAGGAIPRDQAALESVWRKAGLDWKGFMDPWGRPFHLTFSTTGKSSRCEAESVAQFDQHLLQFEVFSLNWYSVRDAKLRAQLARTRAFPRNETEFDKVWKAAGLTSEDRLDPWGHPLLIEFAVLPNFGVASYIYAEYNPGAVRKDVRQQGLLQFTVKSTGAGSSIRYPMTLGEYVKPVEKVRESAGRSDVILKGTSGISGIVTDMTGAGVARTMVAVKDASGRQILSVHAGASGEFVFFGLPPGTYSIEAESPGFQKFRLTRVPVSNRVLTPLTIVLQIGTVADSVEVTGTAVTLSTMSASVSSVVTTEPEPRLRKEFLETLLWQPMVETDSSGQAMIDFHLADNITTWALTAIGSTLDGRVASGGAEIRVFQPFFIEHAPPPVLTVGDELWLPVLIRNYLKTTENVTFRADRSDWFDLKSPSESSMTVAAGGTAEQTVHFVASLPVKEGTQKVTAIGGSESDAVEKKVEVRPHGHRTVTSATGLFTHGDSMVIDIPADAAGITASLRLQPDAPSILFAARAAMLERPYGCAEQTISSTYPSLLILSKGGSTPSAQAQARRYLQFGYDRLLGYRHSGGGFTYFSGQAADLAITAYAIEFLSAAAKLIDVDKAVLAGAVQWLGQQQNPDGTWGSRYQKTDARATAYIASVLASQPKADRKILENAARVLVTFADASDDAYLDAHVLELLHALKDPHEGHIIERLQKLAKEDHGGAVRWDLAGMTPFYSWGQAGEVETTATVVRALSASGSSPELTKRGILFLLRTQDPDGAWYSTHATIRTLEALLAVAPATSAPAPALHATLNGAAVEPGVIRLNPGKNEIRLEPVDGELSLASASVSATYFEDWDRLTPEGRDMKLDVQFDRTTAAVGDPIECRVKLSRTSRERHGMTIAEIGLPPGAEVDRASLEGAARAERFEIQPDRVILYLWDIGHPVTFRFRPRFAMRAWQAESVAYDYYNPDARAVVAPVRFDVTPRRPAEAVAAR